MHCDEHLGFANALVDQSLDGEPLEEDYTPSSPFTQLDEVSNEAAAGLTKPFQSDGPHCKDVCYIGSGMVGTSCGENDKAWPIVSKVVFNVFCQKSCMFHFSLSAHSFILMFAGGQGGSALV